MGVPIYECNCLSGKGICKVFRFLNGFSTAVDGCRWPRRRPRIAVQEKRYSAYRAGRCEPHPEKLVKPTTLRMKLRCGTEMPFADYPRCVAVAFKRSAIVVARGSPIASVLSPPGSPRGPGLNPCPNRC